MSEARSVAVRYTLKLYVETPCDEDGFPSYDPRELEHAVLKCLGKLDGDCDCEVMTTEQLTEDQA